MSQLSSRRLALNSLMQSRGGAHTISWSVTQSGPRHAPMWTASVYIQGVLYGTGASANRDAAKEIAAAQALAALQR
ncbi:hypothetical protein CERSUDRAFT_119088 [Gelatoporia subvermispora B]|uniref:DRBM domain-containing protein n=1 Tax=Ceriporiopsis subvermispora (strain B) TaxID=914234 RepID=M2R1I9_CERS8|nr:hypothetical protein CERSUDRAFT_119088 [Gelatoporia subvermispora B]